MKNAFCFTTKALFLLKIFKFWSWYFGHFKYYDVTAWLTNICDTHIVSRNKSNEIMKLGQLIECHMRNIFFEKSYTKCGGETSSRPFPEKLKLRISLNQ